MWQSFPAKPNITDMTIFKILQCNNAKEFGT